MNPFIMVHIKIMLAYDVLMCIKDVLARSSVRDGCDV